jgi:hypothetical protein
VTADARPSQDSGSLSPAGTQATAGVALPTAAAATLVIRTEPAIKGVRMSFDGVSYVTDARGRLVIPTGAGEHRIQILTAHPRHKGVSVRFARWLDGIALTDRTISVPPGDTTFEAGFVVSRSVRVRFTDEKGHPVPFGTISKVTMTSNVGQRFTFSPADPQILAANRIVRDQNGLEPLPIRYSVREVLIHSSNVVYGGSQGFYVNLHKRTWAIKVLLFPLRIEVRDALFGFPIGSAVQLTLPDHSHRLVRLGADHSVTLTRLPRANYQIVAKGFGFGLSAPTALSKPQVAKVLLLSWADLAVVVVFVVLFVVGLPLVGGRIVRRSGGVRLPVWRGGKPAEAPPAKSQDPVTDPAAQAPEPAAQAPEPAAQATEPATQATEPATQAPEPATQATEPAAQATELAPQASEPADHASAPAHPSADQAAEEDIKRPTATDETAPTKTAASGAAQRGAEPEDPDSTVVFPAITDVADAPGNDQSSEGEKDEPTTEPVSMAGGRSQTDERRKS